MPGVEGRVGMAAVVADGELDLAGLRRYLIDRLPAYARPLFLRICDEVAVTGTFKYSKTQLMRQGFEPAACGESLYFDDEVAGKFVELDAELFDRIQAGGIRL